MEERKKGDFLISHMSLSQADKIPLYKKQKFISRGISFLPHN